MSIDFQNAVRQARGRVGDDAWEAMSLNLQSRAIYEALHALDTERVTQQAEISMDLSDRT